MRHALAISEASDDAERLHVARDLNNLALLLQATNRPTQAEPLLRRCLVIWHAFEQATGHEHPCTAVTIGSYRYILAELGLTPDEIDAKLREVLGE